MKSGSFSAISAIHVLEHLENCYEVVSEFRRILGQEGFVFVIVPNAESIKCRLNYRCYWKVPYEHMNGFNVSSLDFLFTQFGFKRAPLKASYADFSMIMTKYCSNYLNFFPTKLFCIYRL